MIDFQSTPLLYTPVGFYSIKIKTFPIDEFIYIEHLYYNSERALKRFIKECQDNVVFLNIESDLAISELQKKKYKRAEFKFNTKTPGVYNIVYGYINYELASKNKYLNAITDDTLERRI